MSSLWTPGGERPVGRPPGEGAAGGTAGQSGAGPLPVGNASPGSGPLTDEAAAEQLAAMRAELLNAPVEVVVANHCYGLFELAAVYLSDQPPRLSQARLAIDALAAVIGGLEGRLGEAEDQLKDGLSQLRLAFVQIDGARRAGADVASAAGVNGEGTTGSEVGTAGGKEASPGTGAGTSRDEGGTAAGSAGDG